MKSILLSTAALSVAFAPVIAQADDSGASGLADIVVTAQKREENLQTAPLSVSAITADVLEAKAITGVANLTAVAPSLLASGPSGAPNNTALFVRSIGVQDPILTSDSPVALYVDGVIIARSAGSAFEIADLERVEVLRGPQGTLYGRNTIGGAVNLITRKPSADFGVRQKFSVGNYGLFSSRSTIDTGDIGETGLRASVTYLHKENNGYVDDVNQPSRRDPSAAKADGVRAAIAFDKQSGFRANYVFDYNRSKAYSVASQITAARPDLALFFAGSPAAGGGTFTVSDKRLDTIALDDNGPTIDKVLGHALTLEADIGENAVLRSITSYRRWDQDVKQGDFDGQDTLFGPILGVGPTLFPLKLFSATAERRQHQVSEEINLIGKINDRFDYVLGAYFFEEKARENNPQFFTVVTPFGGIPLSSTLDYGHESSTKALFAQGTAHLSERLNVTAGARYTWDEKNLDQTLPAPRDLDRKYENFNWAVSLDYQLQDEVMAYGRIATGYKAGGFSARSFDNGFKPEELTSYEVGMKTEWLDKRLRLNASAYYSERKDMQVTSFVAGAGGAVAITTNAAKAKYKGIELEALAMPVDRLTLNATFGYVDRDYDEYVVFDTATGMDMDIASFAKFSYSPSTTFNAGAQYDFPAFAFGKLAARLDYNYISKRYFDSNPRTSPFLNDIDAPARGLLDARLTLSDIAIGSGDAALSLWGKNISDKEYKNLGTDFGALGFATNSYGDPMTWGLDLSIRY
jgi:iron complex outermembrane receptor protein